MSNAMIQNLAAGAILLAAAAYLGRRAYKRIVAARQPQSGPCGPNCGCGE